MKTTLLGIVLLLVLGSQLPGADAKVSASISVGEAAGAPTEKRKGKGPPPWAPAHGLRAKYSYRYFPAQEVYHRPSDGLWFYYENGKWSAGARLPLGLKVDVSTAVALEMDSDKPFTFHADVKASHSKEADKPRDEPGRSHESGKGKGKGRNK